jgi:hypothetical protein
MFLLDVSGRQSTGANRIRSAAAHEPSAVNGEETQNGDFSLSSPGIAYFCA